MRFLSGLIAKLIGERPPDAPYQQKQGKPSPHSRQVSESAEKSLKRGNELRALKRHDEALVWYDKALQAQPQLPEAWSKRGHTLQDLQRYAEAVDSYDKALAIEPTHAASWSARGSALLRLQRHEDALASCDQALAIQPDFAYALCNRGNALHALKRYDEALASYDKALAIESDLPEALMNRGNALQALQRADEALDSYDKALAINPGFAEALVNRGNALRALQRYAEALACFDEAIAIRPELAAAHWNESQCRLLLGDFERGWKKYEWRWRRKEPVVIALSGLKALRPLWLGRGDVAGKTVLLHAEQGLGDTLQFCRYTQAVAEKGAKVILEVQPALKTLLSGIAGAQQVFGQGESLPEFDFHCPLLSLPLAFDTRLHTVPASVPYVTAPAASFDKWEQTLQKIDVPKIGIVWSGNPQHHNDYNRSIALSKMIGLSLPGIQLVSLQKELRPEDRKTVAHNRILHFGQELQDFSDTAALASHMDIIISVDTSIAHLAGALGKPVWILLPFAPDWRWLLDREDSPWYPTARLFRQKNRGEWDEVMGRVRQQLHQFAASARQLKGLRP